MNNSSKAILFGLGAAGLIYYFMRPAQAATARAQAPVQDTGASSVSNRIAAMMAQLAPAPDASISKAMMARN